MLSLASSSGRRLLTKLSRRHVHSFGGVLSVTEQESFRRNGFLLVPNLIDETTVESLKARYVDLFAGKFETGIYPDEWHWREGISRPDAFREIVNGWKADNVVRSVVTSQDIGKIASNLMGWKAGSRVGQDDILWKPPLAGEVAFHQDAAYISTQFEPAQNNSVTVWIALDDADEETGVVEYCPGSHLWDESGPSSAVSSAFHSPSEGYDKPLYDAANRAGQQNPEIVRVAVPAGGAIFHHQDVWHGSAKNVSKVRHRRALGIHLVQKDVEWRSNPPPDYIYGRYVLPGSHTPEDSFFPVTYSPP
uniref:Phytanoyl-CoA dioxygenase n=1 Tax=Mucochytrium quahogii TaxID=96639 RepID=A0A7S2S8Y4_9STRA|mmetsp:Transcript_20135/g.33258  ORF Transcript_20135/g.33258 Transcript_20135/m.33258 type:complete len:305 (+) Transcript_20135:119-1033(+)|eukprot:CAMPEP_0203751664 /NCGR_PEP_ID=MMETSP0098-20131031/5700_1 /ASSEMBLY_ACC=CAM_ASM_000208 /TAXON_ID=96639 /ORGANISM=" , Strain NY0313808BC1" /LENGTH=304 /DNA_ID=CAMNT_0050641485 /DNA_START=76 /DNA_END=990 /DNA_ORIENTATION=+